MRAEARPGSTAARGVLAAGGEAGIDVAGKVFVDKHPLNTLKLPLIARLFPHAKILFACRDPRDVMLSCFRHRFQMSAPIYELLYAARVRRATTMRSWGSRYA